MTLLTDNEKANAVRSYASQCNGSQSFYRHPLARRMISTDGVAFMAETCGAHWLIDAIASYVATSAKIKAEPFVIWSLLPEGSSAVKLVATNGNDDVAIVTQRIGYSDFPRELLPFKLFCEACEIEPGNDGCMLMLPEER